MDLDFAIVADGCTQREDGKLDIFGGAWDTIFAPSTPARHSRLTLVARILLSRHEARHSHELEVLLQAADGAELARVEGKVEGQELDIPASRQVGVGLVLNIENVVFAEFGTYQLVLHWDGNEARPPIRLFVEQTPDSLTPAEP